MSTRAFFAILITTAISQLARGQNETAQWYFGNKAGLNFLSNPPTAIAGSNMMVLEGCASISDAVGSLLFYTDGMTVWDKTHSVMANGNGLLGDNTSTQSSVIIKRPGSISIYFIVTVQGLGGSAGVNCSIVDMALASGQGSVVTKNLPLYNSPCTEKLTATTHCNGVDGWILTHDLNSDQFRAFLVSASGISSVAVVSSAGAVESSYTGQMKLAINGRKGGLASASLGKATVFDFDNATGQVSNAMILDSTNYSFYGCEFSPDGNKFYCTGFSSGSSSGILRQWDLCSKSNTIISQTVQTFTGSVYFLSLQLALNGKIYAARSGSLLAVINDPDLYGSACGFVTNGQQINPNTCISGLPNIMKSLYKFPTVFSYTANVSPACNTASFMAAYSQNCTTARNEFSSLVWNFGDPASGSLNQSTHQYPVHTYPGPGTYTVKLIVNFPCTSDTLVQAVTISTATPSFSITGCSAICVNETCTLSANNQSYNYNWMGIGSSPSIVVSPSVITIYTVTATDSITGCSSQKSHLLNVNKCTGAHMSEHPTQSSIIFPNPAGKTLNVIGVTEKYNLTILDYLGRAVFIQTTSSRRTAIDISVIPAGVYTLLILSVTGQERFRFIKTEQ
jgi:PKD repeat protein